MKKIFLMSFLLPGVLSLCEAQDMLNWDTSDSSGVVIENSQLSKDTPYSFPIYIAEGEVPTNISMSIDIPASNYGQGSSLGVYFEDENGVLTHGKVIWSETKDLGVESFGIDSTDWQGAKRFGLFLVLNAGSMGQAWADGVSVDFTPDPNGGYNLIFQGKKKNANIQFLPVDVNAVTVNGNTAGTDWAVGIEGDVLEVASGQGNVEATSLDVLAGNGELCWKAHGPNSLVGFSRSNFRMPPGLLKKDREIESGIFVGEDGNAHIVEHGVTKKKLPLNANAEGHGFCIRRENGNLIYSYEGVDVFTSYWMVDDGKPLMANVLIAAEGSYVVDVSGKGFGKRETDSDMDGLSDTWELEYGLNPTNKYDALEDTDGDGVLNYQEYADGTSPLLAEYVPMPTDYLWWMRGTEYSQGVSWIDLSQRGHDTVSDTINIEKVSEGNKDYAYLDMGDEIRCGKGTEPWLENGAEDVIGFTLMVACRPLWNGLGYENMIDLSSGSSSNGGFRLGIQDGVWVVDSPGNEGAYLDDYEHNVTLGEDTVIIVRYSDNGLLEIWVNGTRQAWLSKSLIKNITGEGYIHKLDESLAHLETKKSKARLILSALMSLIAPSAYAQSTTDSFAMIQEIILLGRTVSYAEVQTLNATYTPISTDTIFQTWADYCGNFIGDPNTDPDGDGFSVLEEVFLGTDPFDEASLFMLNISNLWNGDIKLHWLGAEGRGYELEGSTNIFDWVGDEVATGTGAQIELIKTATGLYYWRLKMAGSLDSDEDGLPDWLELCLGSNPQNADTDGDGIEDGSEINHGLPGNTLDTDGDGLMDWEETLIFGTYINDTDTDDDGVSDYDEIYIYGTDPKEFFVDTDGDGWTDIYERYRGTNPYDSDTDKDGIIDSDDDHALVPQDATDVLWWDDQLPEGAIFQGEQWTWVDYGYVEPEPANGIRAVELENNYSYFSVDSANGFQIDEGDVLVNYLYVYSGEEASENDHEAGQRVFVEYFVSDGTSVKLYWGGVYSDGEYTEFRYMGSLPDTGIWTRLEVSAFALGLEGKSLTGMYIESENGKVLWDYSGKEQHPILYDTATLSDTYVQAGEKVYLLSNNSIFIEDKDIEVTLKLQGMCDDGAGGSTPCYIGSPVSVPAIVINSSRVLVTIPSDFESATYEVSAQQEYSYISIADVLNVYRTLSENGKDAHLMSYLNLARNNTGAHYENEIGRFQRTKTWGDDAGTVYPDIKTLLVKPNLPNYDEEAIQKEKVYLRLTFLRQRKNKTSAPEKTFGVYPMKKDWGEGRGRGLSGVDGTDIILDNETTWLYSAYPESWGGGGAIGSGDASATAASSITLSNNYGYIYADITETIREAVKDPGNYHGFKIQETIPVSTDDGTKVFASYQHWDTALRPTLLTVSEHFETPVIPPTNAPPAINQLTWYQSPIGAESDKRNYFIWDPHDVGTHPHWPNDWLGVIGLINWQDAAGYNHAGLSSILVSPPRTHNQSLFDFNRDGYYDLQTRLVYYQGVPVINLDGHNDNIRLSNPSLEREFTVYALMKNLSSSPRPFLTSDPATEDIKGSRIELGNNKAIIRAVSSDSSEIVEQFSYSASQEYNLFTFAVDERGIDFYVNRDKITPSGAAGSASEGKIIFNEISHSPTGDNQWVEFLVVEDIDLRNATLSDTNGVLLEFNQNDLWDDLPAGTLIVLKDTEGTDPAGFPAIDTALDDGVIVVEVDTPNLFTTSSWASLNIPSTNQWNLGHLYLHNDNGDKIAGLTYNFDEGFINPTNPVSTEALTLPDIPIGETWGFIDGGLDKAENADNWQENALDGSYIGTPGAGNSEANIAFVNQLLEKNIQVVINEFSQGASQDAEWIELLTLQEVNLRGWSIENLNGDVLTFSYVEPELEYVPAGTLIVLYNASAKDIALPNDDLSHDADRKMIIPSNDPNFIDSGSAWPLISDSGSDGIILSNPQGLQIASLSFNGGINSASASFDSVSDTTALSFIGDQWSLYGDTDFWKTYFPASGDVSPGASNGFVNDTWVSALQTTQSVDRLALLGPRNIGNTSWSGDMVEFMIVSGSLSEAQRLEHYNMIASRYGMASDDLDNDGLNDVWELTYWPTLEEQDSNGDPDGDGLINSREESEGTHPREEDTDGDGLLDGEEIDTYGTLPLNPDTDSDSLLDGWEVFCPNLNPTNAIPAELTGDCDGDGLANGWEAEHGLNPTIPDSGDADLDGDGLTTAEEETYGTNPLNPDTDGDGIKDGLEVDCSLNPTNNLPDDLLADCDGDYLPNYWEIQYGFDPAVKNDLTQDTDRDGLTLWNEYRVGTNPNKWNSDGQGPGDYEEQFIDTDGDTLPDYYEERFGLDPNIPDDIAQDSDGDGLTLWQEYKAHTDPNHQDTDRDGITDDLEAQADTDSDQLPDIYELWYDLNLANPDDAVLDKDKDGLTNLQEFQTGTFPNDSDTDNDGYNDGGEVDCGMNPLEALPSEHTLDCDNDGMTNGYETTWWFLNPFDDADAQADWDKDTLVNLDEYTLGTDPQDPDTDDDGLRDGGEVDCGLDPLNAIPSERDIDCDGDTMPNGYEVDNNLNPFNINDAIGDADYDGLTNIEEFRDYNTDPQNPDSDGDRLKDGGEVICGLDPANAIPSEMDVDCDGDGMPNGCEVNPSYKIFNPFNSADGVGDWDKDGLSNANECLIGTDPTLIDTDGDGFDDYFEANTPGYDPLVYDDVDWDSDLDGDGLTLAEEILLGTDPDNPDTDGDCASARAARMAMMSTPTGCTDGEEVDAGTDPLDPDSTPTGPPPSGCPNCPPPAPPPTPPTPPTINPPPPPAELQVLADRISISKCKCGFPEYESSGDIVKVYLKESCRQRFSGGCPESGPENVNGSKTVTYDPKDCTSETEGDSFVACGGDIKSSTRKSGKTTLGSYDDPPNDKADCDGTLRMMSTLSREYTTSELLTNAKDELPDYDDAWDDPAAAWRDLSKDERCFIYSKFKLKFKWKDPGNTNRYEVTALVLFSPEDDPDTSQDESAVTNIKKVITWNGTADESTEYTIDPESYGAEDGKYWVVVPNITFITPAGDFVGSPKDSGDGQNEFTYNNANPGALTMNLKATLSPSGVAELIKDKLKFVPEAIGASSLSWHTDNPGGKPKINGNTLTATATFTTLPANNSDFGRKFVYVAIENSKGKKQFYEVFFPKDEKNHPGTGAGITPNWFYYWGQALQATDISYAQSSMLYGEAPGMLRWSYTSSQNKNLVIIYDLAATIDPGDPNSDHGQKQTTGIDTFLDTYLHEKYHVAQISQADAVVGIAPGTSWRFGWAWNQGSHHNHWSLGADGKLGVPGVDDDSDGNVDNHILIGPGELGHGDDNLLDIGYDWPQSFGGLPPTPWAGGHPLEDVAYNQEPDDENQQASLDWGNPGKQHKTLNNYND